MKKIISHVLPTFSALFVGLLFLSATSLNTYAQDAQNRQFNTVLVRSLSGASISQDGPPTIIVGPNVDVNKENGHQGETSVSVDPTNPKHLLFSVNDLSVSTGAGAVVWESTGRRQDLHQLQSKHAFCYDTWLG